MNSKLSVKNTILRKKTIFPFIISLLFILQILSLNYIYCNTYFNFTDSDELKNDNNINNVAISNISELETNNFDINEISDIEGESTIKSASTNGFINLIFNVSQTISNEHFIVNESVIIESNIDLIFNNVTIEFNNANTNDHPFIVNKNTSLTVTDSLFTISEISIRWYMYYVTNTSVSIKDSTINSIGVPEPTNEYKNGLYVNNSNFILNNVSFINCRNRLFSIYNSNNTIIQNCSIFSANSVASIENSNHIEFRNNTISQITDTVLLLTNIYNISIENNNIGSSIEYTQLQRAIIGNSIVSLSLSNNSIFSNGLSFTDLNNSFITNNNLFGIDPNSANWDIGIQLLGCNNLSIYKNTISSASHPRGFSLGLLLTDFQQLISNSVNITDNIFENFLERGIEIYRTTNVFLENNVIKRGLTTDYGGLLNPTGVGLSLSSYDGIENIQNNTFKDLLQAINFDVNISEIYYSNSMIHLNNFIDNIADYNQTNIPLTSIWTVNGSGNYWSSFVGTDIDQNGITEQEKIIVTDQVIDSAPLFYPNIPPLVTNGVSHSEFLANGVNQYVSWHIDDNDALYYSIYINNSLLKSNTLNGSTIISLNVDGFISNWYKLEFIALDRWSNSYINSLTIFIFPDDLLVPIFTNVPANITLSELEPEKEYLFNVTEEHPESYSTILYNETSGFLYQFDTGDLDSNIISVTLGNLYEGNYALNITATDILNQETTISLPVYVQDLGPYIIGSENRTVGQDSINRLEWTFYDADLPIHFWLFIDDILVDEADWVSGLSYNYYYNTTDVTLELHTVKMVANDTKNLPNEHLIYISVIDNIFPVITPFGENPTTIDEFDTPLTFYWNSTDKNPSNYSVSYYYFDSEEENNTWIEIDSGLWVGNNVQYTFNATDHLIGTYQLRAAVTDLGQNTAYSLGGQFQIADSTLPNITIIPMNTTIEYGFVAPLLNWTFYDKNMQSYVITVNGTIRSFEEWNSSEISFYADEYLWLNSTSIEEKLGIYELTLIVIDEGRNTKNASIWITVEDSIKPIMTNYVSPLDRIHSLESNNFTLLCEDMTLKAYNITNNGDIFEIGEFNNLTYGEITIFDKDLHLGSNLIEIILEDYQKNIAIYYINVSLIDLESPLIIIEPSSYQIKYYPTNRASLYWEFWDIRPDSYHLYHNGSIIESGFLTKKIDTVVSFTIGYHNFTLIAKDTSNNNVVSTVIISCLDIDKPIIRSIQPTATMIFFVNDTLFIEAIVEDVDPDYYKIYLNESLIETNFWKSTNEENIIIKLNTPGYFVWNVTFYDRSGNGVSFTNDLIVKIYVNDNPTQIDLPGRTIFDDIALIGTIVILFYFVKYSIRGIKFGSSFIKKNVKGNTNE